MLFPIIAARMKQRHHLARNWIDARKVRPLVTVAEATGQREIFKRQRSNVLAGDHMINVEWRFGEILWKTAILTPMPGPIAHSSLQFGIHRPVQLE
jgi:hypothetical protein